MNNPGGDLLSHRVSPAVPSALEGLTSEFGMGSGVAPPVLPPEIDERVESDSISTKRHCEVRTVGGAYFV